MIVLLGIDDTDNATSRGTGYQARRLGKALERSEIADFHAVTRHQLLVDPKIDYTSRNSSACLVLEAQESSTDSVRDFTRRELRSYGAPESDAGICISPQSVVDDGIQDFAHLAKRRVVTARAAHEAAQQQGIFLEGVGGSGEGVIGALAAVGLHQSGSDGRFIWLPNLRKLTGTYEVRQVTRLLGVELTTVSGEALPPTARVDLGEWVRPVLREGRAILLAEKERQNGQFGWRLVDKPTVKALSD